MLTVKNIFKKLLLLSKLDLLINLNFDNGAQHIFIILHNCLSLDLSSVYIQSKLGLEIINENGFILAYFF